MYIIFHQKKSTHIWISPNASRLCSISIIIFLFSFQALRQTRQQRRHLRISQNLHQKVRIHTFRNSHRVCCLTSICTLHLRIKIFPVIKRILHPLCILSPVLVNDMAICLCYHVRLCMSGIALNRFNVSSTELQLICDTCMSETMKNHIRQSLFINNLLHLITQIAVSNWKTNSIIPWGFFIQLVLFLNYRNAPYLLNLLIASLDTKLHTLFDLCSSTDLSIGKWILHYKQAGITFRFFPLLCVAFIDFKPI